MPPAGKLTWKTIWGASPCVITHTPLQWFVAGVRAALAISEDQNLEGVGMSPEVGRSRSLAPRSEGPESSFSAGSG